MSTDAQKRASTNYNRKQDNIMIRPSKEEGATIRAAAAAAGKSVQGYVLEAVREKMQRETATGRKSPEDAPVQPQDDAPGAIPIFSDNGGTP